MQGESKTFYPAFLYSSKSIFGNIIIFLSLFKNIAFLPLYIVTFEVFYNIVLFQRILE